jgi:hypothetical protein
MRECITKSRLSAALRLPIDVCHIEILLGLRQACDVVAGISKR